MHVGINAHLLSFSPSYRGAGITVYIRALMKELRRADPHPSPLPARERGQSRRPAEGHDPHFTVFLGDPNIPPELAPTGSFSTRVSHLHTVKPSVRILWEQFLLPIELARAGIDILHSTGYVQPFACACRSVVTVHDLSFILFPQAFNSLNRLYLTTFTRQSVRRANRVIAVSENTKQDLVRLFGIPKDKVDVIYHGVEEIYKPHARTPGFDVAHLGVETPHRGVSTESRAGEMAAFRARTDVPERYVLFIGTLEPRKNVGTLIEAFAQVKGAGLPHKLVIGGGKGWLWEEIFATVERLQLQKDVIFPGYIAAEDKPLWYNGADLFVYPSLYEGFGFPPLEAMACGVPVVTSNCSSLPEIVGEAGLLVDPTRSEALAEAMLTVLSDRALSEELRMKGMERARSFSWGEAARKTINAYREA